MERTNKHKAKRRLKWVYTKFKRAFKVGNKKVKIKKPKNLDDSQQMAVDITVKTILNPNSILNYDPQIPLYKNHESP